MTESDTMWERPAADVPHVTTEQMIEVDRAMIQDFGINLFQMMENAGRALANVARRRFLGGDPRGRRIAVLAGTGGNGGGAMVAARSLHGYGTVAGVVITKDDEAFSPVAAHQLRILRRIGVPVWPADEVGAAAGADLIVDGLVGYSLRGAPRGTTADLIEWANRGNAPVLSLDVPSGVDATTGETPGAAIAAAATLTLALPKVGLRTSREVGELYLADIGVPPSLYGIPSLGLAVEAIFARSDIVRLR